MSVLVVTRKPGESIMIGDDVKITIVPAKGQGRKVRIAIEAPRETKILRTEIYDELRTDETNAVAGV